MRLLHSSTKLRLHYIFPPITAQSIGLPWAMTRPLHIRNSLGRILTQQELLYGVSFCERNKVFLIGFDGL